MSDRRERRAAKKRLRGQRGVWMRVWWKPWTWRRPTGSLWWSWNDAVVEPWVGDSDRPFDSDRVFDIRSPELDTATWSDVYRATKEAE